MSRVNVRYLGHSAIALEYEGTTVLIDPFLTGNPKATVSADDVAADAILLTHGHVDHIGDTVAIATRTGATVAAIVELAGELAGDLGDDRVEAVHRVVAPDRDEREIQLVATARQGQVAEERGVAEVVDRLPADVHDDARGRVDGALRRRGRVPGGDPAGPAPVELDGPAEVRVAHVVLVAEIA